MNLKYIQFCQLYFNKAEKINFYLLFREITINHFFDLTKDGDGCFWLKRGKYYVENLKKQTKKNPETSKWL